MSRLPIRARLTAAFALAMVLVLAGAALFVYVRLRADLNESVTTGLEQRAAAIRGGAPLGTGVAADPEDGFAQRAVATGAVIEAAGGARARVLTPGEARRAAGGTVVVERDVAGVDGTTRILALPGGGTGAPVLVVGTSLDDRDETLNGLLASFAIGGPIAVLLASIAGWLLAGIGLRPVERMRTRAEEISLAAPGERLPLPEACDEIRRLGETLNEMLARIEGSMARERRFVEDAGHELRTPIAVVKADLEGALLAGGHTPDVEAALVSAVDECDHLARLADDLLVAARAGDGALPVRHERVRARDLLEAAALRDGRRAEREGRAIIVDAPEDLAFDGDPLRLRQAVGNLVDNALRHGAGTITLRAEAAGGAVVLEVADEGDGFPADLGDGAFDRLARGDRARTRDGAGLGLAIVRAVAEAHGGRAEIAGGGRGTAVRLTLPQPPAAPQVHLS